MSIATTYITTPIFYPNDRLHLGHAYTMVVADIIVRYRKSLGGKVYFQTGSDEHGEKIQKKAASLGISPKELVDKNILLFQKLWKLLGISEHNFYRTSTNEHKKKTQLIFQKLLEKGDIYQDYYRGDYCVSCEDYISQSNNKQGKCSACNSPLRQISEKAYFLRVSKYYPFLIDYYQKNPNFIVPDWIKKELTENFLEKEVQDLCISRNDITWAIPLPQEEKATIYVWLEALLNYVNSAEGEKLFFSKDNNSIIQIVGKDIARFHCIYWPIILHLLGAKMPSQILAHGWILSNGNKMSKSKGNVVDPFDLLDKYPSEIVRTYFAAKIPFLRDGILEENLLKEFYHNFFVNSLSNLISRVKKMLELYNDNQVPVITNDYQDQKIKQVVFQTEELIKSFQKKIENNQLTKAFESLQEIIETSNRMISDLEPWNLFKKGKQELVNEILNVLIWQIKIITYLLSFFAPNTSQRICNEFLGIELEELNWTRILEKNDHYSLKELKKHLYSPIK